MKRWTRQIKGWQPCTFIWSHHMHTKLKYFKYKCDYLHQGYCLHLEFFEVIRGIEPQDENPTNTHEVLRSAIIFTVGSANVHLFVITIRHEVSFHRTTQNKHWSDAWMLWTLHAFSRGRHYNFKKEWEITFPSTWSDRRPKLKCCSNCVRIRRPNSEEFNLLWSLKRSLYQQEILQSWALTPTHKL